MSCSGGGGGGSSTPAATLASITVTPVNPSIGKGATQQFIATGTYSDGSTQNITTSVTWSSSDTNVATIGSLSGLAASLTEGTTTITAASGSLSDFTTLTILPPAITSIAITPANPSIDRSATQQFIATGTYSDSTTQVITSSVTWSSSAPSVASIGTNGLAASNAAGATTITASLGSIFGTTILTVRALSNDNVMTVAVNGGLNGNYINGPFVSVTICSPGTSTCKTINNILLDTGASGLRIFKSLLTDIPLTQVTSGAGSLANCINYVDGSAEWGAVQRADVILGNEAAVNVPIQIIDPTFGTSPSQIQSLCGNPDTIPSATGFNGILGAGLFKQDCGSDCVSASNKGMYYSCRGSVCNPTTVPLSNQVQNPVSLLLVDNNGMIVQLPSVPLGGAASVDGKLFLGIDTRLNNPSSGAMMYPADPTYGEFITVFNGSIYSDSFIDSGSNGLFFNAGSPTDLITCSGWYCNDPTLSLSATTKGYTGSPSGVVSFQIGDASALLSSSNPNLVFIELGGTYTSFDWGLPFFLGRNVYVGIEGKTSSLGTGPYWAY